MGSQPTAGRRLGPSYPDNAVIGIVAKGRVTKEECDSVLRPALEASLKRDAKSRLYYEIGCRFPGAGWADLESRPRSTTAVGKDCGRHRYRVELPAALRQGANADEQQHLQRLAHGGRVAR